MTRLLQTGFLDRVDRAPDATAVRFGDDAVSYAALALRSGRLAAALREAGCREGDRVALFLPKSIPAIEAILGTLRAGAVYVPIDTASPAARIARVVASAAPSIALAVPSTLALTAETLVASGSAPAPRIGLLGPRDAVSRAARIAFDAGDVARHAGSPPEISTGPDDAAHILFTSGSTGVPKGVVITHAMVLAFLDWAIPYFGMAPGDRMSQHPPLHFDLSTFDVHGGLASGAEIVLVPPELNLIPKKLAEFMRERRLRQWFSVPSTLHYMAKFDVVRHGDFPEMKRLLWCGEVFPTPALAYWMKRLPHVTFTNLYGPTEATIASSYYTIPECPADESVPVPIGRACEGEELLVLDDRLRPVRPGETGDLYIAGVGLSPGYWRDEKQTAEAFVPRPGAGPGERIYRTGDLASVGPDGLVRFHGRADSQIKSRGYRIELGEIETALHALGALEECAVVGAATSGFEGTSICCAFSVRPGGEATPPRLRSALTGRLPSYMIPARWKLLPRLPKNANGKIDRRALREMFEAEIGGGA